MAQSPGFEKHLLVVGREGVGWSVQASQGHASELSHSLKRYGQLLTP